MKTEVEVRIKVDGKEDIVLKNSEARELFKQLQSLFEKEKEYIPYPSPYVWPKPWRVDPYWTWTSTSGKVTLCASPT